jgi:mycofactocin system FadH/OYE family oxidoreductase 2
LTALLEKLVVGRIELPNRVVFTPHRTNFARLGRLNDRLRSYYARRAMGGCGLIILGEVSLSPQDRPYEAMIEIFHPEAMADFQKLTQAVHDHGSRIFIQLSHHGFQSSGHITRQAVWGPSALADVTHGESAKAMEDHDIHDLVETFGRAARIAREGGFDGVQIDMGPQSLLRQYLSPLSNFRQDDYGGSIENRMRLPLQVVDAVRKGAGDDFTVGVQLCVDEQLPWGGIHLDESVEFAKLIEQSGVVDYIHASIGTYYNLHLIMASMHTPAGFTLDLAQSIKQAVGLPVMAAYQIDYPTMAETAITEGNADIIGFVRPLICDPDMVSKLKAGKGAEIRRCARGNLGCVNRINTSKPLACVQNPEVGKEYTFPQADAAKIVQPKNVAVIGAGPAGMAVARAAAEKGHAVTIYEKGDIAGGQVNLAGMGAGRSYITRIAHYLESELAKLEVPVVFGKAMDLESVVALKPDVVVVATGSVPQAKPYPGNYGPPEVLTVWDVLLKTHPVGEKVLFVDEIGNHSTLASAEVLAEQGKQIDLVTSELFVGVGIAALGDLSLTRARLLQKGVKFHPDTAVESIEGTMVSAKNVFTNAPVTFEEYDTVIVAAGFSADEDLYFDLKGKVGELHRVGDCVAPRGIEMAIYEGEKVGSLL